MIRELRFTIAAVVCAAIGVTTMVLAQVTPVPTIYDASVPDPRLVEGPSNTAVGQFALGVNTGGTENTAVGFRALATNSIGDRNTATGFRALDANNFGSANSAIGHNALWNNTSGGFNTAIGAESMWVNSTGSYNTGVGMGALLNNTTGLRNSGSGYAALSQNNTGRDNTAYGTGALANNTTGGFNVAVGADAGASSPAAGSHNIFIGAMVYGTGTDTNIIRLGLPFNSGTGEGQNKTFIAGIHGTQVTGPTYQVVVNGNGQLGTLIPPAQLPPSTTASAVSVLQQQVQEQQAINAELRARLERLEAASRSPRRR